jgi:hypothetical protein
MAVEVVLRRTVLVALPPAAFVVLLDEAGVEQPAAHSAKPTKAVSTDLIRVCRVFDLFAPRQ